MVEWLMSSVNLNGERPVKSTSGSVYERVLQEALTKGRRLALNEQHHMGPGQNSVGSLLVWTFHLALVPHHDRLKLPKPGNKAKPSLNRFSLRLRHSKEN